MADDPPLRALARVSLRGSPLQGAGTGFVGPGALLRYVSSTSRLAPARSSRISLCSSCISAP